MSLQKKATIIASLTAFILALFKLIVGIFSNSIAIISSAVDSLLDMFISIFNFFAVSTSEKKPDKQFNFGRGKIEALASFLEGLIIIISGIFIFYESIKKIINKEAVTEINAGIFVMIFSIIVTLFLVYFLNYVGKKTNNLVIKADSLHYKTDLFSNIGILIGLVFIYFTNVYYIDAILGIIIACYIIYSAFEIIKKGYFLLLDVSLEQDEILKINKIIKKYNKITDFHELKTRQSGNIKFVSAHLVFDKNISLVEAHDISHKIEDEIRLINENNLWSILFHLDPYNDEREDSKSLSF